MYLTICFICHYEYSFVPYMEHVYRININKTTRNKYTNLYEYDTYYTRTVCAQQDK